MRAVDGAVVVARALEIARGAGDLIRELQRRHAYQVEYKGDAEPVTSADVACDGYIREEIANVFPSHRVLSEETTGADWTAMDLSGPLWVVDPIDGTANYAHGHPYVNVSIAFAIDGVVQAGVVHAPFLGETFTAVKGAGAQCNGVPIGVASATELRRAVVSTGFPYQKPDLDPLVERVRRLLAGCQDIRRACAPALDICYVAAGRLDAHTETLNPWDVAAAGLIATEAGASRSHLTPVPAGVPVDLCGEGIVVSAPGIHDALVSLLTAS